MLSSDSSSLKGYDLVISITEDAINKQFRALYDKEIPSALMPTPEELEGYVKLPAAKHYINHDLSIQARTWESWDSRKPNKRPKVRPDGGYYWVESKTKLEGTIDAPTVSFREEADNFRSVRVHIKFLSGKLSYFDGEGEPDSDDLDGGTFSWVAHLSHTEVENVMKSIIKPSAVPEDSTLVPPEVLEKFIAIKDEDFSVTALFCLFQSVSIVNSFQFFDGEGHDLKNSAGGGAAVTLIANYFSALSKTPPSAASPNNPFVLGYGLRQKIPKKTAEDVNRAANAPYLIPKEFDLTVTSGDGEHSNGVINYCILTHRAEGVAPSTIDREGDMSAGHWVPGNTPYTRIKANGMSSGADGVIAFSRGIFRDFWLKENFMPKFKIDTAALSKSLVPENDTTAQAPTTANYSESTNDGRPSNNKLYLKQTFDYNIMPCQDMDTDKMKATENLSTLLTWVLTGCQKVGLGMSYKQRRLADGIAEATLEYTSDVQKNPNLSKDSDINRKIYFDVALKSFVNITQQASGICNINRLADNKWRVACWFNPITLAADLGLNFSYYKDVFEAWRNARQSNIQIRTKIGLDMVPAGDTWSLQCCASKERTTIPFGDEVMKKQIIGPETFTLMENINSAQKMEDLSKRMAEDGIIIDLKNHEMFKQFGTSSGMDNFAKPANQWATDFETRMEQSIGLLASSLMTKLILPAGNTFEFKSLSTDAEGHVYSLITYKTPTDVEVISALS